MAGPKPLLVVFYEHLRSDIRTANHISDIFQHLDGAILLQTDEVDPPDKWSQLKLRGKWATTNNPREYTMATELSESDVEWLTQKKAFVLTFDDSLVPTVLRDVIPWVYFGTEGLGKGFHALKMAYGNSPKH